MVMLRNIMDGKYSMSSPEWADVSGEAVFVLLIDKRNSTMEFLYPLSVSFHCSAFVMFTDPPKDLIRRLLVVDPSQRITIDDALRHPFFMTVVSLQVLLAYQKLGEAFAVVSCT